MLEPYCLPCSGVPSCCQERQGRCSFTAQSCSQPSFLPFSHHRRWESQSPVHPGMTQFGPKKCEGKAVSFWEGFFSWVTKEAHRKKGPPPPRFPAFKPRALAGASGHCASCLVVTWSGSRRGQRAAVLPASPGRKPFPFPSQPLEVTHSLARGPLRLQVHNR